MKSSYLLAGIKLFKLLKLISRNHFSIHPKYLLRLFFLLQSGFWSSLFSAVETIRFKQKINSTSLQDDPIFIIGHWRTGSTFLHQLLNLSPSLSAPTLFQVGLPDSFICSRFYYKPVMNSILSKHRPMDWVKLGFDEPQEDEWALFRMTCYSPLEKLIFPNSSKYFLLNNNSFVPENSALTNWKNNLMFFCKKLTYKTDKQIVLKNPFHSLRISTLNQLFPNARFIHIYRHPYAVVPSTIRMWDIVGKQNCMNNKWVKPGLNEVVEFLDIMLTTIQRDMKKIPDYNYTEVKFEDLEQNPIKEIKRIFEKLELRYSTEYENNINKFLNEIKDFKKNKYVLTTKDKETIDNKLNDYIKYYGYLSPVMK